MAKERALDFTNVKDRGDVNPKHQMAGDYRGKVMSVKDIKMGEEKRPAWLFILKVGTGTYPYRCGFRENELWKIRNLFVAGGITVPKKKLKVLPDRIVGKDIGLSLDDHEYNGRMSSEVAAVFPLSELEDGGLAPEDDEVDADGEDEEEDEGTEIADEPEDEDDEPAPAPKQKKNKKAKKAKAPANDDLEELDIEDM